MGTLPERLKEERARLGMSQTAFGEIGGVQKRAQINYEAGERVPDATYLVAISFVGADVQYIVTGVRSHTALTDDEQELLERYRSAPLQVKAAAIGALMVGATALPSGSKSQKIQGSLQVFHQSPRGQVVGGDLGMGNGTKNVAGRDVKIKK